MLRPKTDNCRLFGRISSIFLLFEPQTLCSTLLDQNQIYFECLDTIRFCIDVLDRNSDAVREKLRSLMLDPKPHII